jgi:hypothetical protein
MPLLTALLVVGAFAAFFVSFLFAPFAVLALLYGFMMVAGRARKAKKRRQPAPSPVTTAGSRTPVPAAHHDKNTTA